MIKERGQIKPGDQFGFWTVVNGLPLSRGISRCYLCKCRCGKEKEVYRSHLIRGNSKSCGCRKGNKRNPPVFKGSKHYKWTGCGEITGHYWNKVIRSANGKRSRGPIPITITIKDAWDLFLKQNGKCALSGIKLSFQEKQTASLDRIDSNRGYEIDNIQWIHKDINRMKNVYSNNYFIKLCNLIAKNLPCDAEGFCSVPQK